MIRDDLRWFAVIPDLAWPSGSDLEWPWTAHGPDIVPTKRHMEPIKDDKERTWHQLDVNLGRLGADLGHLVANLAFISVILGPTWASET